MEVWMHVKVWIPLTCICRMQPSSISMTLLAVTDAAFAASSASSSASAAASARPSATGSTLSRGGV